MLHGWEETKSLQKQLPAQSKGALLGLKAGFFVLVTLLLLLPG